jgi:hypothetical protein
MSISPLPVPTEHSIHRIDERLNEKEIQNFCRIRL